MLEEVITLASGKKVTKEFIEEKYKVSSTTGQVVEMVEVFKSRDTQKGLQIIATLTSQGIDMKYFMQKIMENLHEQMLAQVSGKATVKDNGLVMDEIRILFSLLSRANGEMKYAVLPQLPLELVVLEWTTAGSVYSEPFDFAQGKLR